MDSQVVEPVDVVECGPFGVFDIAPRPLTMNQLGLVEIVGTISSSIVVGIALGANRGNDVGVVESFGVADREILNSAIEVMHQVREVPSVARIDRHLTCVDGQITT